MGLAFDVSRQRSAKEFQKLKLAKSVGRLVATFHNKTATTYAWHI